jgi:hypothetical protein
MTNTTTPSTPDGLAACPKCQNIIYVGVTRQRAFSVCCNSCGYETKFFCTEAEAIAAWAARAALNPEGSDHANR